MAPISSGPRRDRTDRSPALRPSMLDQMRSGLASKQNREGQQDAQPTVARSATSVRCVADVTPSDDPVAFAGELHPQAR